MTSSIEYAAKRPTRRSGVDGFQGSPQQSLIGRQDRQPQLTLQFVKRSKCRQISRQQHQGVASAQIQWLHERMQPRFVDGRDLTHRDDIQGSVRTKFETASYKEWRRKRVDCGGVRRRERYSA